MNHAGEWNAFESLFTLAEEEDSYAALRALRMDNELLRNAPGAAYADEDSAGDDSGNPQFGTPASPRPARRTLQWLKRNVGSFRITVSLQRPGSRQRTALRTDREFS